MLTFRPSHLVCIYVLYFGVTTAFWDINRFGANRLRQTKTSLCSAVDCITPDEENTIQERNALKDARNYGEWLTKNSKGLTQNVRFMFGAKDPSMNRKFNQSPNSKRQQLPDSSNYPNNYPELFQEIEEQIEESSEKRNDPNYIFGKSLKSADLDSGKMVRVFKNKSDQSNGYPKLDNRNTPSDISGSFDKKTNFFINRPPNCSCGYEYKLLELGANSYPRSHPYVECTMQTCWREPYICKEKNYTIWVLKQKLLGEKQSSHAPLLPESLREDFVFQEVPISVACECIIP